MPSPSEKGWLKTSSTNRTVMNNTSLEAVLDAIISHVGAKGTVLLVCHADSKNGLYMRIAAGAAFAATVTLKDLSNVVFSIWNIGRPASAQHIPDNWLADKTIDDWKKMQGLWPWNKANFVPVTAADARKHYFDSLIAASNDWKLGSWRALVRLALKILDVQEKQLDRLEMRACWFGKTADIAGTLQKLLKCTELVAPEELNFFIELPIYHRLQPGVRRTRGSARQPGPTRPVDQQQKAEDSLKGPNTRLFRDYTYVVGSYSWGTLLHSPFPAWPAIAVTVNRKGKSFDFDGIAYLCNPTEEIRSRVYWKDRDIVRWFIDKYIQDEGGGAQWLARHPTGKVAIPFHGLWTPNDDIFVLPYEAGYQQRINCF